MKKNQSEWGFSTRAVHIGSEPDPVYGAVVTPIFPISTYRQSAPGVYVDSYDYGRTSNPTRVAYENCIASLEGGAVGISYASGLAAISAILDLLPAGSHIIAADDLYGGTARMFNRIRSVTSKLEVSYADLTNVEELKTLIKSNTKLLWVETPTNPMLKIFDLKKLAEFAQKNNLLSIADNTFASPYLQNPLRSGFDIVIHSATKYIGGHSDLVNGMLVMREDGETAKQLRFLQYAVGAVPGPFDCFLAHRGVKTLALRMRQQCQNAQAVAEFLSTHKRIAKVIYPGLKSHPQHDLALAQMSGLGGGMVSFVLNGNLEETKQFFAKLKVFTLAESLGAVESLIEHPAIMTHASLPAETRQKLGISDGFVRISCGVEDQSDLIADLESALS